MRHVVYDIITIITWACWVIVGLTWAAGAVLARRHRPQAQSHPGRDIASLTGAVLGVMVVLTPASLWRTITAGSLWLRVPGVVVLLAATAGVLWARQALGTMWSSAAVATRGHQLRTTGPYRITRHPIYTAVLGMLAGTALTQGGGRWVALVAVVALVLMGKIRAEERLLSATFPHQYECYRREVPRLVPRLLPRRAPSPPSPAAGSGGGSSSKHDSTAGSCDRQSAEPR